jgi:hypothetical protein
VSSPVKGASLNPGVHVVQGRAAFFSREKRLKMMEIENGFFVSVL